jgi:hypothetical protein
MSNPVIDQFGDDRRWVLWRYATRDGKKTKVPYQVNGRMAKVNDPSTWATYATVQKAFQASKKYDGPGIVLHNGTLLGCDGDHKLTNGSINDPAWTELIEAANSYTEITPSGEGLRILIALTEPLNLTNNKSQSLGIEFYTENRYLTFTGRVYGDVKPIRTVTPDEARQLMGITGWPWQKGAPVPAARSTSHPMDNDMALLEHMFASQSGELIKALWEGDTTGFPSASEADWALVRHLVWWTGHDKDRVERLWLQSTLGERGKVMDRQDYRDRTINNAMQTVTGGYAPPTTRASSNGHHSADGNGVGKHEKSVIRGGKAVLTAPGPAQNDPDQPGLPEVQVNGRELRDVSADAMRALVTTGNMFVRSGELVRVRVDEKGHASIETIGESALRSMLARAANFFTYREKKMRDGNAEWVRTTTPPPLEVVRDVLALGTWTYPPIEGVIESPTMRPDGSIIKTPGYDPATQLFYQPIADFELPEIPEHPSQAQARNALRLLRDVVVDFPFEDEPSRDNALGAILTPAVRPMIRGSVPIALYDAPQQATGKTLLASITGLLSTGEMPDISPAPTDPEEWRKAITSQLSAGRSVIVFDNVTHALEDGSLAGATTATTWSDRLMGRNDKQIRVPARSVWMVTGNNLRVGGDLVSRCYLIRIDAKMSRPQERENFKHPNLEQWIREHRGELIGAVLTIARAWVAAGRPKPTCPKMRQEEWRDVIGGMLEHAGGENFLRNQQRYYETADDDTPAWEAFITKLSELWPKGAAATPGQIYARFSADEVLAEILPDELRVHLGADDDAKAKSKFTQRLGYEFKSRKGKRYGDTQARIEAAGTPSERKNRGGSMWRFVIERSEQD